MWEWHLVPPCWCFLHFISFWHHCLLTLFSFYAHVHLSTNFGWCSFHLTKWALVQKWLCHTKSKKSWDSSSCCHRITCYSRLPLWNCYDSGENLPIPTKNKHISLQNAILMLFFSGKHRKGSKVEVFLQPHITPQIQFSSLKAAFFSFSTSFS